MLPAKQLELWEKYCAAEKDRIRSVSMPALNDFLDSLAELSMEIWCPWAYHLCGERCDRHSTFPVRMPLFQKALGPALVSGLQQGHPNCARWLGGFADLLYHSPALREELAPFGEIAVDFLEIALSQDPADASAHRKLIHQYASGLEYAVHELPVAVIGGETIEKTQELVQDLKRLRELLPFEKLEERYSDLILECEFHFPRWIEYLEKNRTFSTYVDFLRWEEQ